MIYFRLNGGLGNQLSQFAASRFFENKYRVNIFFDDYYLKKSKKKHESLILDNLFLNIVTLDHYKVKISRLINKIIDKFGFKTIAIFDIKFLFDEFEPPSSKGYITVVEGFWQTNEIYKSDAIDAIYQATLQKLKKLNSKIFDFELECEEGYIDVAMHIRRGDYLTNKHFFVRQQYVLPVQYYIYSMNYIKEKYGKKLNITIFSDDNIILSEFDIKDCNLKIVNRFQYTDLEAFYLFSCFNICIIANSTYSMWAALISNFRKNGQILAPSIWHKNRPSDISIIPKNFTLINLK